jgi:hypothetical protein
MQYEVRDSPGSSHVECGKPSSNIRWLAAGWCKAALLVLVGGGSGQKSEYAFA